MVTAVKRPSLITRDLLVALCAAMGPHLLILLILGLMFL